jgi:hypothetical protein
MWIFTKDGFFSIVKHKDNSAYLMVKSRVREDLVDAFGPDDIKELAGSDYRFRKTVPRAVVADYLKRETYQLDYESVKDNIDKGEDDRHKMLYSVWAAHMALQRGRYDDYDEGDWYDFTWTTSVPTT